MWLSLQSQRFLGPVDDRVAVEEGEHRRLDPAYGTAWPDRGRDDHVAAVVERDGQRRARTAAGHVIGPAPPFHLGDGNRAARIRRGKFRAEQLDIADALQLLIVGYPGAAIAEADLGPQIKVHRDPA